MEQGNYHYYHTKEGIAVGRTMGNDQYYVDTFKKVGRFTWEVTTKVYDPLGGLVYTSQSRIPSFAVPKKIRKDRKNL